jgi:hypothetical protein
MRINIWIVLAVLLALLAITRFARYESDTQRICVDDPSASVCARYEGWAGRPAVLFIKSFVHNDPAEFERADDLVVRRPIAGKNHAD